ncbi:MAG: HlyD family efflux transporter periplasmic adaptor subunit [Oscillospiraceae bacterium]|nr:HlyD family efflux transporter periplasmic adaptor subunit [Oscillospiraceae bacterium]
MNTLSGKITAAVLSLFLLAYVGFNVWRYLYSPVKTETVIEYTIQDTLQVKGLVIRDEIPVAASASGVVRYYYDDGVRVIPGMAVAEVRKSREDVLNTHRIGEIEEELEALRQVQETGEVAISFDFAKRQADEALSKIIAMNLTGVTGESGALFSDLQTALNKRQAITDPQMDFSVRISSLEGEKSALEGAGSSAEEVITVPEYGYFSSYCDDGAQIVSTGMLEGCTAKELNELAARKYSVDSSQVGKVIEGYSWYYAAMVEAEEAEKFSLGDQISLNFNISSLREVPGTVSRIILDEADGPAAVIFKCNYMSPQLSSLRNPSVQIEFRTYSGLRIPNRALRFEGDVQGVYVSDGQQIRFKKVDILYEGVDFVLASTGANDSSYVQLYDDIIVEGTDLYDGKPLND